MANTQRKITYSINFQTNTAQLDGLKNALKSIRDLTSKDVMKINNTSIAEARQTLNDTRVMASKVEEALSKAFNYKLNTVNVKEFNNQLQSMNLDLTQVQNQFSKVGAVGTQNFINMTNAALETNLQVRQTAGFIEKAVTTLKNTLTWNISSSIVNKLTGSIQEAYGYVKNLDTSLNDIRIVTGASADEMDKFAEKANKAAAALGKSTNDYTEASLIYYQQGLSDEEVEARSEITLKAANVTGQSTQEVSEQLTAVWNGYNASAEEAELYVDRLAAVAASTASDLEELSTGMSKVASAAAALGVGEDQLAAQLSTIISVTRQAPESVGTALKTIYARMSDIKAGVEEEGTTLGSYTSEMAEMGINVLDATGSLRDMGSVIEEIGGKWSTFSREQQIALAQTMAGTRQYNNLIALFDNWDSYIDTLEVAQNAQGTLQEQQDIYMESTAAHLEQLNAATEGIFDSLLNAGSINSVADVFTKLANGIEVIIDSAGGGLGILSQFSGTFLNMFSANVGEFFAKSQQGMAIEISNRNQLNEKLEESKQLMDSLQNTQTKNSLEKTNIQSNQAILSFGKSGASVEEVRALTDQYKKYIETATQAGVAQETLANSTKLVNKNFVESVSNLNAEDAARDLIIEKTENLNMKTLLSADSFETFKKEIQSTGLTTTDFNNKLDEQSNLFTQLEQKIESTKIAEEGYKKAEEGLIQSQEKLKQLKIDLSQMPVVNVAEITTQEQATEALKKYCNELQKNGKYTEEARQALEGYLKALAEVNQKKNAYTTEQKALEEVNEKLSDNANYIFSSVDAVKILNNNYEDLKNLGKQNAAQAEQMAATFRSIGTQNLFSGIYTGIIAVGQGISNVTNLFKQWKNINDNEDLSYWEKLGQKISLVSSSLMSFGFTYNMAIQAAAKFKTVSQANTAALAIEEGAHLATAGSETVQAGVTKKLTFEQLKLNAATYAFPAALIVAAIAVVIGAIISLTDKVKNAEKQLDEAKKKTEESKQALDDLTSSWENLNNTKNNLDNLTEGTLEWKKALVETNNQVLELLDKFPELAKGVTIDDSGLMTINEDAYERVLDKQVQDYQNKINEELEKEIGLANQSKIETIKNNDVLKSFYNNGKKEDDLNKLTLLYSRQGASILSAKDENGQYELSKYGFKDEDIEFIQNNLEEFDKGLRELSNSTALVTTASQSLNLEFINTAEEYKNLTDETKKSLSLLLRDEQNFSDTASLALLDASDKAQNRNSYKMSEEAVLAFAKKQNLEDWNNKEKQIKKSESKSEFIYLAESLAEQTNTSVENIINEFLDKAENDVGTALELLESNYANKLKEYDISQNIELAKILSSNQELSDLIYGNTDINKTTAAELEGAYKGFQKLTTEQKIKLADSLGYEDWGDMLLDMENRYEVYVNSIKSANEELKKSSIAPVENILSDFINNEGASDYSTEVFSSLQNQLTQIWSQVGAQGSQTFANLFKQIPVDQADEFLAIWNNFDWSTGDTEQFTNLLREQGIILKDNVISSFEELGIQINEASKKSQTLKFSLEGISKAGKIAEKTSVGDIISDKDYAELLSVNSEISKFFEKTIDGYKYLGSSSGKSLSQLVTNIDEVRERAKELSKEVNELQNKGFKGNVTLDFKDAYVSSRNELNKLKDSSLLKNLGQTEQLEEAMKGIRKLREETENFTDISQEEQEQLDTYEKTIRDIYALASQYVKDYGSEAKANYQAEKVWIDLNIKSLNDLYKAWDQGIINDVQAYNEAKEYQLNLMREELGLSDELIAKYAEMHTGGDQQAAVQQLNAAEVAKDFYNNQQDYLSGYFNDEGSVEYLQSIEKIQDAMETILGGTISEEFIKKKENINEFIKALEQGGDALEKFQKRALMRYQSAEDILKRININEDTLTKEVTNYSSGETFSFENEINITNTVKSALKGDQDSLASLYWWAKATGNEQLISDLGIERKISSVKHIGNTTYNEYTFYLRPEVDVSGANTLSEYEKVINKTNTQLEIENTKYEDLNRQIDRVNTKLERLQKIQSNLRGTSLADNLSQQVAQYEKIYALQGKQASRQQNMANYYLQQAQAVGAQIDNEIVITADSSLSDIVEKLADLPAEDAALGDDLIGYLNSYYDAIDSVTSLEEQQIDTLDDIINIQKDYIDVIKDTIDAQTAYQDYRTEELQEEIDKNEAKSKISSPEEQKQLAQQNYELSKKQADAADEAWQAREDDLNEFIDSLLTDEKLDASSKSLLSKYFSKDNFDAETGELTQNAYQAIQDAINAGEDQNGILQAALDRYLEIDDQRDQAIINMYNAKASADEAASEAISALTSSYETDTSDEEAKITSIENQLEEPFSNESQIERNQLLQKELTLRENILNQKKKDLEEFTNITGDLRKQIGEEALSQIEFDNEGAITNLETLKELYHLYPGLEEYINSYQKALEDLTNAEKDYADSLEKISDAILQQSQDDIKLTRDIDNLNKELKELQENDNKLTGTKLIENIDAEISKTEEIIEKQEELLNNQKASFDTLTEIFSESNALKNEAIDWAGDWESQLMELAAKAMAAGDKDLAQEIYNILNALRAASDQIKETEDDLDSLNDSLEDLEDKKLSIELEVDESSYHNLDIALKSIERELKSIQKASKGLSGQELINNLNKQEAIIRKQIAAYQQKLKLMQIELLRLQQILALQGVAFNADGTVSNYAEIFASGNRELLSYIQTYEQYQERIFGLMDTIEDSQYTIKDIQTQKADAIAEKAEEEMKKRLEEFNAKIDVELDIAQAKREWNRFKKEFLEGLDDIDIFGNAKADLEEFISYSETDIPLLTDHLNDIMREISIIQTGGTSSLYGTDQSAAFDDLVKYRDQLISSMQSLQELIKSIEDSYLEQIKKIQSKFDDQLDTYKQITSIIEHNMNIIKMLRGDDSYKELAKYYQKQEKNYNAELQHLKEQVNYWKNKMESASAGSEEWELYQQNWKKAVASLNETVESAVQNIIDKYTNVVNEIFDKLEKKVTNGLGLNYVNEEWDLINQNADSYLDKINSAYEIQKLQNKYLEAIDNSDSVENQKKLNTAMEEELKKLREKEKLTQYDIDRANAMYEVTMKQIALEEAQKSKTSMRLRRDSEGNYRYEYVSDQDEIAQKQQELLDAQNQLYNIDKEQYRNNLDEMLKAYQSFQNALYELYADQTLTEEEREQRKQMLIEQYESLINGIIAENEVIKQNLQESTFMNLAALYDEDISALQNMAEAEKDVLMSELVPQWDTAIQQMIDKFAIEGGLVPTCEEAIAELIDATLEYRDSLEAIEDAAGISFEDIMGGIDDTIGEMENLIQINESLLDKYDEELSAIDALIDNLHSLMDAYQDVYDAAIQAVDAALELREAAIEALEAFDELDDSSSSSSSSNTSTGSTSSGRTKKKKEEQSEKTPKAVQWVDRVDGRIVRWGNTYTKFRKDQKGSISGYTVTNDDGTETFYPDYMLLEKYATGGYTGEWGPEGKLAVLHEKELILNKDDTANMLKMIELTRNKSKDYSEGNNTKNRLRDNFTPSNFLERILSLIKNKAQSETKTYDSMRDSYIPSEALEKIINLIGNRVSSNVSGLEARTYDRLTNIDRSINSTNNYSNTQDVNINANFPSATSTREIENAFNNLRNIASQRANKSSKF